jgi:hypothetical protein
LSFQKQHDYPWGVKRGLTQLQIGLPAVIFRLIMAGTHTHPTIFSTPRGCYIEIKNDCDDYECMQNNREDSRSRSTPVYFLPPPTAIVT